MVKFSDSNSIEEAINRGLASLASLQGEDGSWKGFYGGPSFLLPNFVIAYYITGRKIDNERSEKMARYIKSVISKDGSIGLHSEGSGCMFTTALNYAALRILGADSNDPACVLMRRWIMDNGTALGSASWGKFMLALINCYPYDGLNPILPELWLMPDAFPVHPGRMWCHTRQVYLPMAYLYGKKSSLPENSLIRELRRELYATPYDQIDFTIHRNTVSPGDNLYPVTLTMKTVNRLLLAYEKQHSGILRRQALKEIYRHIIFEDANTGYIALGPVNKALNAVAHYFHDPGCAEEEHSFQALESYIAESENGVFVNGYSSTALWDTVFSVKAILAAGKSDNYKQNLAKAKKFICNNRIPENVPDRKAHYRDQSRGGWPFGDKTSGWPVTDCTAEGIMAMIELEPLNGSFGGKSLAGNEMVESARLLLDYQNSDGGWSSYEPQRSPGWLELLNPSQVFGDIMVEHSYVECTSAVIQGLVKFKQRYPSVFTDKIKPAINRGLGFLKKAQREDGGFYGSWAVCFAYGTWFGVKGLLAAGIKADSPEIQKAADFIITYQNADGGWGEHYKNCVENRWIPDQPSHSVTTSWALMTLILAGRAKSNEAKLAAEFLISRQEKAGGWPKEGMTGVFNKTVLIDYDNYRRYFPLWALGMYRAAID